MNNSASAKVVRLQLARGILALLLLSTFSSRLSTSSFAQGPLTPPDPPAPTMKTLDQIEPRKPISSLPFNINQSGSYYLTENLRFTAASGNAITIAVSNVTVDLMGFTLSSTSGVTGDAIRINAGLRNIAVKNGVIAGNTTVTLNGTSPDQTWAITPAGFSNGIRPLSPEATGCQFSHLRISGCRSSGLNAGGRGVVEHVTAIQNGSAGITGDDLSVTNCTTVGNGGDGIDAGSGSVTNCTANSNRFDGITGFAIASSMATGNGITGITAVAGSVTNCTANNNKNVGIFAQLGSVTNCTALANGGDGIRASSSVIAFCRATDNNANNDGSTDIDAPDSTRTGNRPTP